MALAADVPSKYDVVINGQGYILSNVETQRAIYGYTPTFIERTNISGSYGDNQQDFWLTATQKDWSLGEQQKFFRVNDSSSVRKYWSGTNVDVRTPGQVTLRPAVKALTYGTAIVGFSQRGAVGDQNMFGVSTTKLYETDAAGGITDRGAHSVTPYSNYGVTTDGVDVYIGHTAGVRKYTVATTAFSAFSATPATSLEFLNNNLYGLDVTSGKLLSYDTAGVATTIYTWKTAAGVAQSMLLGKIRAYGGQLLIQLNFGSEASELWVYDGSAVKRLNVWPRNFVAYDMEVLHGIVFVGGGFIKIQNGTTSNFLIRPAVHFYQAGSEGLLWQANGYMTTAVTSETATFYSSVSQFENGLFFTDDTTGNLMFFDPASGSIHSAGTYAVTTAVAFLASTKLMMLHGRLSTTGYLYPDTTTVATSGTIVTSLIDFDSSLSKNFRAVSFDGTIPSGATVDIEYQLDGLDGSWTTLQTAAAANTDYTIGQAAHSVALRFTLNKGSSTAGPTLKRYKVLAAPTQSAYRIGRYILDLSGRDGNDPVVLRNGEPHKLDGFDQATNLKTAATSTTPVSITDRLGTFTGIIQSDGFELVEIRPEEFIAHVKVRQV